MSQDKKLSIVVIGNGKEAVMVETRERLSDIMSDAIEVITADTPEEGAKDSQGEYIYILRCGDLIDAGAFGNALKVLDEKTPDILFTGGLRVTPYVDSLTGNKVTYRRDPDIVEPVNGTDILPLLIEDEMSVDKLLYGRSFIRRDIITEAFAGQEHERLIILAALLKSSRACYISDDVHIMRKVSTIDPASEIGMALDEYYALSKIISSKSLTEDGFAAAGKIASRILNDIRCGVKDLDDDQKALLKSDVRPFDPEELIVKPLMLSSEVSIAKAEKLSEKQAGDKALSQVSALKKEIKKLKTDKEKLLKENKILQKENTALQAEDKKLRTENKKLQADKKKILKAKQDIKRSVSFRTGRFLTWPWRKIRDLITR